MLRFSFEGTVLTDRSDAKADRADLASRARSETCGGVPAVGVDWFCGAVERAVLDRIRPLHCRRAPQARVDELERLTHLADLSGFAGMNL